MNIKKKPARSVRMDRTPTPKQRRTEQKNVLLDVFAGSPRPLTPAEALGEAQRRLPGMGLATVYRALTRWVQENRLAAVHMPGEPVRYERAGLDHHHHFRCDHCARVYDMPGCALKSRTGIPKGFLIRHHTVLYSGLCADCRSVSRAGEGIDLSVGRV